MTLTYIDTDESIDAAHDPLAPIPMERRRTLRRPLEAPITAVRCGHDPAKHRLRICAMELCDTSMGGMAMRSDTPLEVDEPLAMTMPAHGPDMGLELQGHVVHCRPVRDPQGRKRFEIGVQLDTRPAA